MIDLKAIYEDILTGSKKESIEHIAGKCERLIRHLESKNNILFLTTSTRYREHRWDVPKTTQLARRIKKHLERKRKHVTIIEVTTLGEQPIPQLKTLEAGIVLFGQNWNDEEVLKTQKQNFNWFGWRVPDELNFYWQYTKDVEDESAESYSDAVKKFGKLLQIARPGRQ